MQSEDMCLPERGVKKKRERTDSHRRSYVYDNRPWIPGWDMQDVELRLEEGEERRVDVPEKKEERCCP